MKFRDMKRQLAREKALEKKLIAASVLVLRSLPSSAQHCLDLNSL